MAKVIIMIICTVVFMLIDMNRIMHFMPVFLIAWRANANAISGSLKNGQRRAD